MRDVYIIVLSRSRHSELSSKAGYITKNSQVINVTILYSGLHRWDLMKYSLKIKWEENWTTQPVRGELLPDNGTYIPLEGSSPNQHLS